MTSSYESTNTSRQTVDWVYLKKKKSNFVTSIGINIFLLFNYLQRIKTFGNNFYSIFFESQQLKTTFLMIMKIL